MAQHDYVIDNSTGANVRADINSALGAIIGNNSGDPSTLPATAPFMLVADTTDNTMKLRNAANNGFIELFQLDGTYLLLAGSASNAALAFQNDLNTGIFSSAADTLDITTAGSKRFTVDSSGRVRIGCSAQPSLTVSGAQFDADGKGLRFSEGGGTSGTTGQALTVIGGGNSTNIAATASYGAVINLVNTNSTNGNSNAVLFKNSNELATSSVVGETTSHTNRTGELAFLVSNTSAPTEVVRINSSGHVGIGTSNPSNATLEIVEAASTVAQKIKMGTSANQNVHLELENNGSARLKLGVFGTGASVHGLINDSDGFISSTDDLCIQSENANGIIKFGAGASGATERLRITGIRVLHNCTSNTGGTSSGIYVTEYLGHVFNAVKIRDTANTGTANAVVFVTGSTAVGTIVQTGSATSYNTSSDYRLKENESEITNGITRLKLLKPLRFNWKKDPDTRVDGFFAHEAQEVVPEAVTGKKDEIADCDIEGKGIKKGQKIYQQMDNAKLVPLLTAAIKEAVSKIEVLETKVAALEAA